MNIEMQKQYRIFLLVLLYFIIMMMGIAQGASASEISPEREYLYSFVFGLVLTHLCIVDRRIIGKPLLISSYWLVFIFFYIAVPFCIIKARGLRGLAYVTTHFIGMALVLFVSFFIAGLLSGMF